MLGELISTVGPNHIDCCDSYNFMARPKLKLSLFALYRPTRKFPADSKDFIGKKVLLFFLFVTTVHRFTFYSTLFLN